MHLVGITIRWADPCEWLVHNWPLWLTMGQAYNEKECFLSTHHPSIHLVWCAGGCLLVSLEPPEKPDLPPTLHIRLQKEIFRLVRLVCVRLEMTFVYCKEVFLKIRIWKIPYRPISRERDPPFRRPPFFSLLLEKFVIVHHM